MSDQEETKGTAEPEKPVVAEVEPEPGPTAPTPAPQRLVVISIEQEKLGLLRNDCASVFELKAVLSEILGMLRTKA